jgi:hypothetical protein
MKNKTHVISRDGWNKQQWIEPLSSGHFHRKVSVIKREVIIMSTTDLTTKQINELAKMVLEESYEIPVYGIEAVIGALLEDVSGFEDTSEKEYKETVEKIKAEYNRIK